jgi:hypothetical protein
LSAGFVNSTFPTTSSADTLNDCRGYDVFDGEGSSKFGSVAAGNGPWKIDTAGPIWKRPREGPGKLSSPPTDPLPLAPDLPTLSLGSAGPANALRKTLIPDRKYPPRSPEIPAKIPSQAA